MHIFLDLKQITITVIITTHQISLLLAQQLVIHALVIDLEQERVLAVPLLTILWDRKLRIVNAVRRLAINYHNNHEKI